MLKYTLTEKETLHGSLLKGRNDLLKGRSISETLFLVMLVMVFLYVWIFKNNFSIIDAKPIGNIFSEHLTLTCKLEMKV